MVMASTSDTRSLPRAVAQILRNRATWIAVLLWLSATVLAWTLAGGFLPFDQPALARLPFAQRMAFPTIGLVQVFALMAITFWLTRNRAPTDIAARAPDRRTTWRETIGLLSYATLGQIGGWLLGPALGYRPFSFHIAGTLVGCSVPPSLGEIWVWAIYNFVIFAVLPLLWFRQRYSATDLNLRSTNRRNDLLVIVVIGVVESVTELAGLNADILKLSTHQFIIGGGITLFFYVIGTVLPTMILIYAILLPRYLKLTGSTVLTVILGGLTYAVLHLVEGWSVFTTPRYSLLSVLFVFFSYFGPGMIKSVLTLRTGNAWVHAWGYHAVAPHLLIDTPLFVKALSIA